MFTLRKAEKPFFSSIEFPRQVMTAGITSDISFYPNVTNNSFSNETSTFIPPLTLIESPRVFEQNTNFRDLSSRIALQVGVLKDTTP